MSRKSSDFKTRFNRRSLLKGAAAGGAVVATEAIGGFPTVWAQNAKDVTLVHAGGSYAVIKEIGEQATKDLGFKLVMQAITDDVQLNRSLTQPNTIDINNIDSTKMPYLVGKACCSRYRRRNTSTGARPSRCSPKVPIRTDRRCPIRGSRR